MKGNNGDGNNVDRDVWRTPQELFVNLDMQYNFTHDCCAMEDGSDSRCNVWSYDFLKTDDFWTTDVCWMNPPFSKAKEMFEHFFKVVGKGVCIYRCDNMETAVWQDVILPKAAWILIPKGRISYEGFEGKGARFASALIGYNVPPPEHVVGKVLYLSCNIINV